MIDNKIDMKYEKVKDKYSGLNTLNKYEPLLIKEQTKLMKEYHKTKDNDILTKLIYHNTGLIGNWIANKKTMGKNSQYFKNYGYDDLYPQAMLILTDAIKNFDFEKAGKLSTYVYKKLDWEIVGHNGHIFRDIARPFLMNPKDETQDIEEYIEYVETDSEEIETQKELIDTLKTQWMEDGWNSKDIEHFTEYSILKSSRKKSDVSIRYFTDRKGLDYETFRVKWLEFKKYAKEQYGK